MFTLVFLPLFLIVTSNASLIHELESALQVIQVLRHCPSVSA